MIGNARPLDDRIRAHPGRQETRAPGREETRAPEELLGAHGIHESFLKDPEQLLGALGTQ